MRHDGEDLEQLRAGALHAESPEGELAGLSRQISSARTRRHPSETHGGSDDLDEHEENSD